MRGGAWGKPASFVRVSARYNYYGPTLRGLRRNSHYLRRAMHLWLAPRGVDYKMNFVLMQAMPNDVVNESNANNVLEGNCLMCSPER
jgi:hypothetical protein